MSQKNTTVHQLKPARRVQEAGAEEFVSKPIDPIELERLLEKS